MRKGFFASGGAARPKGTSMMTEDVAAPIDRLADFVIDLRQLLDDHGYEDAIIFGHALAGNLHFQMSDNFMLEGSAEKFDRFSRDLSEFVSVRYGGSLKAEHGTGRAIAPFVEREWGSAAYRIMQRIKPLFDPENLLNPGVLITSNQKVHIEHLKLMPLADPVIDLCIECGFCEPACPSAQLTISPAPAHRHDARDGAIAPDRRGPRAARCDERQFRLCRPLYLRRRQCLRQPLPGRHRDRQHGDRRTRPAADRQRAARGTSGGRPPAGGRARAEARHRCAGAEPHHHRRRRDRCPWWPWPARSCKRRASAGRPAARAGPAPASRAATTNKERVVYYPAARRACSAPTKTPYDLLPAPEAMVALLTRAGFDVVVPDGLEGQCCGQPFLSKGFPEESERVEARLIDKLEQPSTPASSPTHRPAPSI